MPEPRDKASWATYEIVFNDTELETAFEYTVIVCKCSSKARSGIFCRYLGHAVKENTIPYIQVYIYVVPPGTPKYRMESHVAK